MLVFPILHTERLKLRKIQVEDFPSLVKYANNKKVSDNVINIPHPYQEPNAAFRMSYVVQGFKKKSHFVFSVVLKERTELIGEMSLHLDKEGNKAELGYWIGEPFWGEGIATEAAGAIIEFGFEKLGLDEIFATCHEENMASVKVVLKNGMKKLNTRGRVAMYWIAKENWGVIEL